MNKQNITKELEEIKEISKRDKYALPKRIILFIFIAFKSLFLAITEVAWGLVSLFGLNLILVYMLKEGTPLFVDKTFLMLEMFITNNIMPFVIIFFCLHIYFDIRSLK
jgi:hypothetical protein